MQMGNVWGVLELARLKLPYGWRIPQDPPCAYDAGLVATKLEVP